MLPKVAFSSLSSQTKKKKSWKNTHASITVTMVRHRKIWTALRTNQIVGFVTVPAWKKKKYIFLLALSSWSDLHFSLQCMTCTVYA